MRYSDFLFLLKWHEKSFNMNFFLEYVTLNTTAL